MRNIWKREMQNTTDGIPQEERSRWKPLRARAEAGDQEAQESACRA